MASGSVEQIKARLSIADVVGGYVKLERAGSTLRARCPFHNEKTPSFHVSPDRGSFKCFGCGKGGDIFTFIQEIEGIEFRDALKLLADRAGVQLEHENMTERSERSRVLEALAMATRYYREQLERTPLATQYLLDRGVDPSSIERFEIGFAPPEWQGVYTFLHSKGFTHEELDKTGLCFVVEKPGKPRRYVDRFRSRIMFPITNPSGHVVGFSGRIFGTAKNPDGTEPPKYINSPQTIVYDKSSILFGYSLAKSAFRTRNRCVVVEGQMDLVMSHQADVQETVAVSGTALTREQLSLIKRLTDNVIFAFDADDAGIKAARRSVELALGLALEVKLAAIEHGKDPADLILHDPQSWKTALDSARGAIAFFAHHFAERHRDDPRTLQKAIQHDVIPLIAVLPQRIDRAHFSKEVSEILRVPAAAVMEDVERIVKGGHGAPTESTSPQRPTATRDIRPLVFGILAWGSNQKDATFNVAEKLSRLKSESEELAKEFTELQDEQLLEYTVGAEAEYDNNFEIAKVAFDDLLHGTKLHLLETKRRELEEKIRIAEQKGDTNAVEEMLRLCQDIGLAIQKTKHDRNEKNF